MIISCITTASNKAVFIKGIPFRIVQIKGFVVNTETNQVLHICINRVYIEPFKLQLKMVGSKYCVEYYFYNEDNLPVQSFAFVIATSDEEAIQKAQNYSTSKITIISCTKYA